MSSSTATLSKDEQKAMNIARQQRECDEAAAAAAIRREEKRQANIARHHAEQAEASRIAHEAREARRQANIAANEKANEERSRAAAIERAERRARNIERGKQANDLRAQQAAIEREIRRQQNKLAQLKLQQDPSEWGEQILLQAGDIEENPGPPTCRSCNSIVRQEDYIDGRCPTCNRINDKQQQQQCRQCSAPSGGKSGLCNGCHAASASSAKPIITKVNHERINVLRNELATLAATVKALDSEIDAARHDGDPDTPGDSMKVGQLLTLRDRHITTIQAYTNELEAIDPIEQARRSRLNKAKDVRAQQQYKKQVMEEAQTESARRARDRSDRQVVSIISDYCTTMLDSYNATYQAYITKELSSEEAIKALENANAMKEFAEQERQNIRRPDYSEQAQDIMSRTFAAYKHHRAMILEQPALFTNVDDWEQLVPTNDEDQLQLPTKDVQTKLLNGINVEFPFSDMKPTFQQSAAHPIANSSRIVLSTLMYMNSARKARSVELPALETRPAVVYDAGSGNFGAERIQQLRLDPRNAKVAIHASIPEVDDADQDRVAKTRANPNFLRWNYVPETRRVNTTGLNYCRHRLSECDCFKYYAPGARFVTAIHSSTEFDARDWTNVFRYTNCVEAALHVPRIGETLPLSTPEYQWVYADRDEDAGIVEKIGHVIHALLTGNRRVRLKPMKCGAIPYTQDNIEPTLRRGGFHLTTSTTALEKWTKGDTNTAIATVATAAAAAVGAVIGGSALGITGLPLAATTTFAAVKSVAMTAMITRANYERTRLSQPLFVDATVSAHIVSSYGEAQQEETAHCVRFLHGPPRKLVPRSTESVQVDRSQLGRVTSALVMAKDKLTSIKQMAGALLRDDVPPKATRDTVAHAVRLTSYVVPNEPQSPPWYYRWRWASVLLPIASAAQFLQTLALDAASSPAVSHYAALVASPLMMYWLGGTTLLLLLTMWWATAGAARCARE